MGTAIVSGMLSSSHTQEVPEQTQEGRVSEPESIKLPLFEPADGVMLFWLQVRDNAPPTARDPYGEVQAGLRIDPVQDRSALKALKVGPQLLGHLSPERLFGTLTRQDVTAREVPHVWIPPPTRRPVTEQHLVCPSQDRGNDVMILHRSSMTLAGQKVAGHGTRFGEADRAAAPAGRPRRGGHERDNGAPSTYTQLWRAARKLALAPEQAGSPLAGRPYDLRHAAVSLWLNAGVPAPTVARRAGHSVDVLLRVYANCIDGDEEIANKRISGVLS